MILGIGTDIVRLERIQQLQERFGERFFERILSFEELSLLNEEVTSKERMVAHMAKRFAAKEAIAKAFGVGIGEALSFQDITIFHQLSGKPDVALSAKGDALLRKLAGIERKGSVHLSISDEHDYAIAFAVIEAV